MNQGHCTTTQTDRHGIPILCRYYAPEPGGRDCCPLCGGSGRVIDPQSGEAVPCPAGQDVFTLIGRMEERR